MSSGIRGQSNGEWLDGTAIFTTPEQLKQALKHRNKKYGFKARLAGLFSSTKGDLIGIKISLEAIKFDDYDVIVLCISTHKPDDIFSPQVDGLLSIVEKISKEAKTGALVSIESTVPKGTPKKVFELLNHRLHVVHAPHRWYALEEKEHGVNQLRVIGGVSSVGSSNK